MFDSFWTYQKVCTNLPIDEAHLVNEVVYRFTSSQGVCYLVRIWQYEHKTFVVKFHLKDHKNDKKKYQRIVNHFKGSRVLATVIQICLSVYKGDDLASFAFVGAHKLSLDPEKCEAPEEYKNQRFRTYKRLAVSFFGTATFEHIESEQANCYLLVNRKNDDGKLADRIREMFMRVHPEIMFTPTSS